MALSTEEINKVNEIYKQLDVKDAEIATLKEQLDGTATDGIVLDRLDTLTLLVRDLLAATKKK